MAKKQKKLLKTEKVKIKKTLPKGQNETKTNFKVKSIVIKHSLQKDKQNLLDSSNNLNLKAVISRLSHHNVTMRLEALAELKEVVKTNSKEVLGSQLRALLEGVVQLSLDIFRDIRKAAAKLLSNLFSKISHNQIFPFFNILQSYLNCAMTHINPAIREDSLLLMDCLLESFPSLASSLGILPAFLDLISKGGMKNRTITVNLGSKFSGIKWRISVLKRLNTLLSAIVSTMENKSEGYRSDVTRVWQDGETNSFPVYNKNHSRICILPELFSPQGYKPRMDLKNENNFIEINKSLEIKSYAEGLIPILTQSWLEIRPDDVELEGIINDDAASLLLSVVQIYQLLWRLVDISEVNGRNDTVISWFKEVCYHEFSRHLLVGFPFSRQSLKTNKTTFSPQEWNSRNSSRLSLNLSISLAVVSIFTDPDAEISRAVVNFINECLQNWQTTESSCVTIVKQILITLLIKRSKSWQKTVSLSEVLENAINLQKIVKSNHPLHQELFRVTCQIALDPDLSCYHNCKSFEAWSAHLPDVLCGESISIKTLNTIVRLCCQRNSEFISHLTQKMPDIINNIHRLKIVGITHEREGWIKLSSLFYWIESWSKTSLDLMEKECVNWNVELAQMIVETLGLKKQHKNLIKTEDMEAMVTE